MRGVEAGDWKAYEEADPSIESDACIPESLLDLFRRSLDGSRVRYSPGSGHRLPGPNRTYLVRSIVADRDDKIQLRSTGGGKFLQLLLRRPVTGSFASSSWRSAAGWTAPFWMASSEGTGRIPRAKKQHVVVRQQGINAPLIAAAGTAAALLF